MNSYEFQVKLQSNDFCEGFSVKEVTNKMKNFVKSTRQKRIRQEEVEVTGENNGNFSRIWMHFFVDSTTLNLQL